MDAVLEVARELREYSHLVALEKCVSFGQGFIDLLVSHRDEWS